MPKNSSSKKQPTGDYIVGYCRTPKKSRFKSGQPAANPRGRPKGSKKNETSFRRQMNEKITVTVNGQKVKVTLEEAIDMRLFQKAAEGDMQAIREVNRMKLLYRSPTEQNLEIKLLREEIASLKEENALLEEEGKTGILYIPRFPNHALGKMILTTSDAKETTEYILGHPDELLAMVSALSCIIPKTEQGGDLPGPTDKPVE